MAVGARAMVLCACLATAAREYCVDIFPAHTGPAAERHHKGSAHVAAPKPNAFVSMLAACAHRPHVHARVFVPVRVFVFVRAALQPRVTAPAAGSSLSTDVSLCVSLGALTRAGSTCFCERWYLMKLLHDKSWRRPDRDHTTVVLWRIAHFLRSGLHPSPFENRVGSLHPLHQGAVTS